MHKERGRAVNKQCPAVSWPDLTSRSFFREMTAEAKNASSVNRREECRAQKADPSGFVRPGGGMTPSSQSGARISPSPANQRPRSGPLPVAFSLSVSWAVSERAGGCWIPRDPYLHPPELWKQLGYCVCLIWSAEEPQVKWPTREHDLWSNKCRVAHSF